MIPSELPTRGSASSGSLCETRTAARHPKGTAQSQSSRDDCQKRANAGSETPPTIIGSSCSRPLRGRIGRSIALGRPTRGHRPHLRSSAHSVAGLCEAGMRVRAPFICRMLRSPCVSNSGLTEAGYRDAESRRPTWLTRPGSSEKISRRFCSSALCPGCRALAFTPQPPKTSPRAPHSKPRTTPPALPLHRRSYP